MAKILVIDDDPLVRSTVSRMLRHWGYLVVLAEDGRRGLEAYRRDQPDLVVTDIIMPEIDGIETIREIRAMRPDAQIIAMSGGGRIRNLDFLNMAAKLGAAEIISKPFDPAQMRDAVTRCLAATDARAESGVAAPKIAA